MKIKLGCFAIVLLSLSACERPRNVVVPPIPPSDILALAPELALNQKPVMGDNGLEALIAEFEILPYEARYPYENKYSGKYEELAQDRKDIILSEASEFVDKFDQLEKLEWGLPIFKGYETTYPQLSKLKEIGRYFNIASRIALEKENTKLTIRLFIARRRLAVKMDEATNTTIAFLTARSSSKDAERNAAFLLDTDKFNSLELKQLLSNYDLDINPAGLDLGFRGEWESTANWIATIRFPQDALETVYWSSHGEPDKRELEGFRGNKNPFDRISTANEVVNYYKKIIIDKDYVMAEEYGEEISARIPFDDQPEGTERSRKIDEWKRNTPNSFGLLVSVMACQSVAVSAHEAYLDMQVDRDLNRVKIACLIYQKEHGKLPTNLDNLSEFNMKRGVVDQFSGQPFGYDSKRKIIWSVGKDNVDDNGLDRASISNSGPSVVGAPQTPQTYDIVVHLK